MLLVIKRVGIRNFAGGQRVALYRNDAHHLEFSVPYDPMSGKLSSASTGIVTKEEVIDEGGMPSGVIKHKQKLGNMSDEELADYFKHHQAPSEPTTSIEHRARQVAWRHGYGHMDSHYWDRIKKHVTEETIDELSKSTLGSYIKSASVDATNHNAISAAAMADRYHDTKKASLPSQPEIKHKARAIKRLSGIMKATTKLTELSNNVLFSYATKALDQSDDLVKKSNNLYAKSFQKAMKRQLGVAKAGRHLEKQGAFKDDDSVQESAIHHLSRLVSGAGENSIMFANGASTKVHPLTAKAIMALHSKVNKNNQSRLSQMINSSPRGLERVAKFALKHMPKKKSK